MLMRQVFRGAGLLAFVWLAQTSAGATYSGTLKWKGASSGGNWNEPSNWEVTSGSLSVSELLQTSCRYNLTPLANGAELVNNTKNLKIGAILYEKDGCSITLSGEPVYWMSEPEIKTWTGSTINILCGHPQNWNQPDGQGKLVTTGSSTVRFAPTSALWLYKREIQPCDTTTVAIDSSFSQLENAYFRQWGSSTLRVDYSPMTIGALCTSEANAKLNLNGKTLRVGGAENCGGRTTYAGKINGAGRLEWSGGDQIKLTGQVNSTGTFALYDGAVQLTPPTSTLSLEVQGGGAFSPTASATFKSLSGDGTTGGVEMPSGSTLTVGGAEDATFNGHISGAANVVKTGTGNLTLAGANGWTGLTEVKAGTLTLKGLNARKGQIAYFGFEDASAFGKECGLKGYAVPGYVTNVASTPTAEEGVVGSAIQFPAATAGNCKYECDVSDVLAGGYRDGDPFSMDFWIRTTGNGGSSQPYVLSIGKWYDLRQIAVIINGKNFLVMCMNWNLSDGPNSPSFKWDELFDGAWHHVAITYDNKALKVYADGEVKKSTTLTGGRLELANSGSKFTVGNRADDSPGGHRFAGGLDELRLWNRALTADEIAATYANRTPSAAETDPALALPKPVCHWAFDDASAPGKDSMGNADLETNPQIATAPSVTSVSGAFGTCLARSSSMKLPASRFPTRFPVGNVPYTVSIRLLPGEQGEQVDALHWGDLSDPTKSFRLFVNGCPRSIYAACGGNEWLKTGRTHSYVVNADAWKHYVVTYKAGVVTVYRDGKQTDRITGATSALVASDLWLNCVKAHTSANTCYLDDVRIYDVALTKDEVAVLSRSLKTGLSGAVVSAETSLKVDAGATVNAQGGRIGVKGLNGAGVVSLTGGTTLAVDDMSAFSGSVSGAGCLKLSGSTQATIGCPVELAENGTFASTGGVTPCVETSRRVIVPETGRLAFDAVPHGLVKQVIAKGSELMLPSSFNGWSCTFADGETTRVKFFAEDGEFYALIGKRGLIFIVE